LTEAGVGAFQAAFYITTGVWPLLHRRSFECVTGRKTDLVAQTVGASIGPESPA
jgi:hypothetical protein